MLCALLLHQGCHKTHPKFETELPAPALEKKSRLPIEVNSLRDGGTLNIRVNGGLSSGGWDVYFAYSTDPKVNGQVYSEARWREPGFRPLSRAEALKRLEQVESILKDYYKNDLDNIRRERDKLGSLTYEEQYRYQDDPQLNDRLHAHYALDLIDKYRTEEECR